MEKSNSNRKKFAKYSQETKKSAITHIQGEDQISRITYNMDYSRNFNPNSPIAGEGDENYPYKSNKIPGGCQ